MYEPRSTPARRAGTCAGLLRQLDDEWYHVPEARAVDSHAPLLLHSDLLRATLSRTVGQGASKRELREEYAQPGGKAKTRSKKQ